MTSRGFLLALCLATSAGAADKDPWIRVSTTNFDLFTTAGERAGRDLAKYFEQVHGFFVKSFGYGIDPGRKARVMLFKNEKEYEAYRPNQVAAAFFHGGEYHDYIVMYNGLEQARPVAAHELAHLMLHQLGQELPVWINEGLAEFYSSLEPRGNQIIVGRDIPHHMRALASGQLFDLHVLLTADHKSPMYNEKAQTPLFYAESWKLAHMLQLHPEYRAHWAEMIGGLLRRQDPETVFQNAYGKTLAQVQTDLRAYLSGGTISALVFDVQLPKSVDAPAVDTSASLTARLSLAEMLSNTWGKAAQATDEYRTIAQDFPNRWEVAEAQGLYAWHLRKLDEAVDYFAKAEALGCQDGSMFLLWGRALGFSSRPRDAVAALAKAVKSMPDSNEAKLEYGNALVRNGNWGAAVATLNQVDAKKVPQSGQWRYLYNVAYADYKLGDAASAKAMSAKARTNAASPREISALDQLDAALNRGVQNESEITAPNVRGLGAEGESAPVLKRKDGASLPAVEGELMQMECGSAPKLHIRANDAVQVFLIPDPRKIPILSGNGKAVELDCGPQKNPRTVRVEYSASPDGEAAAGVVRSIAFK